LARKESTIVTEATPGPRRRTGHWLIDAGLGGAATLAAIGLAHAALPPFHASASAPAKSVASVPSPAAAPVLIAFREPAAGDVVSPFGLRQLPWEAGGRLHEGIDIRAEPGAPVAAAADGVVVERGADPGYGRFVVLRHADGLTTLYAHLSRIQERIAPGAGVRAGDAVGAVGSTGSSTGPHLHFEIRDGDGRPLNPALFLGRSFATADALPLAQAQRFAKRVRIAQVSMIPVSKRGLMLDRAAAADALHAGVDAVAATHIDGLQDLHRTPAGRVRARMVFAADGGV
jgi:murein DD-endopeptidase MepM/ murein hydrolase activator NlpD